MEILGQFDSYSLKARVFPALIAGLPILTLLFIIVPWDHLDPSHASAAAMDAVLLFAFVNMARRRGKNFKSALVQEKRLLNGIGICLRGRRIDTANSFPLT